MRQLSFALFGNVHQPKKSLSIQKVLCLLQERKAIISIDRHFHHYLTNSLRLSLSPDNLIDDCDFTADIAISMGGDGTFLEAASRVRDKDIPILGINMGHLGFLADVPPDEAEHAIQAIYDANSTIEQRTLLSLTYDKGQPQGYPCALNEIAVLKQDSSSMISVRVDINGEYLATYQADGLIINTPTGSTGYALSAGGPIMPPDASVIGITAVAPHSLNVRPITLPDTVEATLTVNSRSHRFLVAIDGRSETCHETTRLTIRKAPYTIKVIKRPECTFLRTLRGKLMLGSDIRVDNSPLSTT